MFKTFISFLLLVLASSAMAQQGVDYRLDSGDRISIHVFGEEDLSLEATLSQLGTISYPFLGDLAVKGKTITEVEKMIVEGLKGPYLIDPKVNVSMETYREFYINGEVENSGGYPYQPGLTLRRAISIAGGFTERASRSKIYVVRSGEAGSGDEDHGEPIGLDDYVMPGDTITVGESFF